MAPSKTKKEFSTLFGFHEKITLCSYVPRKKQSSYFTLQCIKKNKAVAKKKTKNNSLLQGRSAYSC